MMENPEQVEKRPLLKGGDPEAKLEEILAERRPQYQQVKLPREFNRLSMIFFVCTGV